MGHVNGSQNKSLGKCRGRELALVPKRIAFVDASTFYRKIVHWEKDGLCHSHNFMARNDRLKRKLDMGFSVKK